MQMVFVAAFMLMTCWPAMAQNVSINGVVKSEADGEPLLGVNIIQKGTTNGTVTDIDGKYTLSVPAGSVIEASYIGFIPQTQQVMGGGKQYNFDLREDSQSLDEVVVVGYGVQKKKLVTGATVQVSGDDIQKMATNNALAAMQSQTPGVLIQASSGQPGSDFKVRIRGTGTTGNSNPLYIVDGIPSGDGSGALNNLNPSDIESIDVLKDAASAAIYGARASNGVILITTKQGTASKVQVSYDGFVGLQTISKFASTLDAKQYMQIQDERVVNEGLPAFNWSEQIPKYLLDRINGGWGGTDWQKEAYEPALSQNHALNITGGNNISKFSIGASYNMQESVLAQKQMDPQFKRYTFRINSSHVILKGKDFDAITVGENLNYNYRSSANQIGGGNRGGAISQLMRTPPLMPVYDQDGNYYDQDDKSREGWNLQGSLANPFVGITSTNSATRNYELNASAFLEIQPIKGLKLRSVYGYRSSNYMTHGLEMVYKASTTLQRNLDHVYQNGNAGYSLSWENTINYTFLLNQLHSFDVLVGQSIEQSGFGESISADANRAKFPNDFERAYIGNTSPTSFSERWNGGSPYGKGAMASFFGRVNYNYKETYMASLIMRADGSSNFARGHRWGYFPSASVGWVITNEGFMESARDKGLDFLKIRASWGQNGNSRIDNFQYLATVAIGSGGDANQYYFGDSKTTPTSGAYADILPNPTVSWETSEQTDLGFDARVLNSRLGINFDWYRKDTKDWLLQAPMLASFGTGAPQVNGGSVRNQGIELGLNWNDRAGALTYRISANAAYNRNEVLSIANTEGIIHGGTNILSQGTTEMYRAEVGFPIGYFWGYKTAGVFQNQSQIDAYQASGKGLLFNAQPGDLIFVDTNQDGVISDLDKVQIGDPNPHWTGSLSVSLGYKGFDFSVTAYGNFGMQVAKSYRDFADSPYQNFTTDILGRWHGEGTSNKLPRLLSGSHTNWQYISDIYIQNADFVKISNVRLGYDFKKLLPKVPVGKLQLYATVQNLLTITGYDGMDPEVSYGANGNNGVGNWASGIDLGMFPAQRVYQLGVSINF
ncbi:SusC/RagA family TonB-linked outer membrane protein [Bacteroidia bacterium]|nr:SusC/RagA family TonB-linked outer membrane protein [Bacteroidia bacterium]